MRPALGWAAIILVLCLTPGSALPEWQWADLLSVDKFIHAAIFGILVLLLVRGFKGQAAGSTWAVRAAPIAAVIGVLYGASMEGMQQIPGLGRHGDLLDLIANTIGCLVALIWLRWRRTEERMSTETKDA
ncbi:MAG: VanZ family protein [Flavobacteriales bacterium]